MSTGQVTQAKRVQIRVTAEDIRSMKGRHSGTACPVYRAACRALNRTDLYVGRVDISASTRSGTRILAPLPRVAVEAIRDYDDRDVPMKPFRFTVSIETPQ